MPQNFRHPEILDIARRDGRVLVENLASRFGVTVQTIRRDLKELSNAGQLERVHGGAVIALGARNIAYEARRQLNAPAKVAMARKVAALVPNGTCLFLNIGTSTEAVARELLGHENLLVITNNLNVAQIFAAGSNSEVILTAGHLRKSDGGLTGPLATQTVGAFRFDMAVIGCSGLSAEGDLLDYDMTEVEVSQAALERSACKILVADHTKVNRTAPWRITGLESLDAFVTDRPLPDNLRQICGRHRTTVHAVDGHS